MAGDSLKLKFGVPAQVDNAEYAAGTMYLAKKDSSTADLYFDMGGTRLEISPSVLDSSVIDDLVDQVATAAFTTNTLNEDQIEDMIDDI